MQRADTVTVVLWWWSVCFSWGSLISNCEPLCNVSTPSAIHAAAVVSRRYRGDGEKHSRGKGAASRWRLGLLYNGDVRSVAWRGHSSMAPASFLQDFSTRTLTTDHFSNKHKSLPFLRGESLGVFFPDRTRSCWSLATAHVWSSKVPILSRRPLEAIIHTERPSSSLANQMFGIGLANQLPVPLWSCSYIHP